MMDGYKERTAHATHEAGHAVAVIALGGRLDHVDMDECVQAAGSNLDPWSGVLVCAAGAVAARTFGPRVHTLSRIASERDIAVAEVHLERLGRSRAYLPRAEFEAKALLMANQENVRHVRDALMKSGFLSGQDVERLMGRTPRAEAMASPSTRKAAPVARTRLAPSGTAAVSVEYETHQLDTGEWCAAVVYPLAHAYLGHEGVRYQVKDSETAAIDALSEGAFAALGCAVALVPASDDGDRISGAW